MRKIAFTTLCFLLLSCGHDYKNPKISYDNYHGYYKIGNPYKVGDKLYVPKEQPDYEEEGMASWYGSDFHGKKTANGDVFDQNALTAAHNTLPLPSMVRVTNLENGKTLIVMVNDRGPFSKKRIIDVSKRAAEILGFKDKGTAKVRVQFLPGQTSRLLSDIPGSDQSKYASMPEVDIDSEVKNSGKPVDIAAKFSASPEMVSSADNSPKVSEQNNDIIDFNPSAAMAKPIDISTKANDVSENNVNKAELDTLNTQQVSGWKNPDDMPNPAAETAEKVEKPLEMLPGNYIQAGTYSMKTNASSVERKLASLGDVYVVPVERSGRTLYQVKLGPLNDKNKAEYALRKVILMGHPDAIIVNN